MEAGPTLPASRPLLTGHSSGDPGHPRVQPVTAQPAGSTHFRPCLLVPDPSTWAHGGPTRPPSQDGTREEGPPHVLPCPRDRGQPLPFSQTNPKVWVRLGVLLTSRAQEPRKSSPEVRQVSPRRMWPPGMQKLSGGTGKPRREAVTSQGETL